jgi:glycerophosphoryl diester phosphodiesterase
VKGRLVSEQPFSQDGARLVVAHRGASVEEAENTIEAFERALAVGADAVEFDVRLTLEGVPVVLHDADVARTTDGAGLVRDLTSAEVRALRIRTHGGATTGVPTLEDTLRCLSGRASVDIEIKNVPGDPDFEHGRERAVEATLACLHDVAFVGRVIVSSFNPFSIAAAKRLMPDIETGLLTEFQTDARAGLAFAHDEGHAWILPWVEKVRAAGSSFADDVHDAGLRLGVWVVDEPDAAIELWWSGVDAVATNDPATIVARRRDVFGA